MKLKPCRACGSTRVERMVVGSRAPTVEVVIVTCASCGNRRNRYERRRRR